MLLNIRIRRVVFVAIVALAFALGNTKIELRGIGKTQPTLGKGTVYVTRTASAPNGAILKPVDLSLSIFTPVVSNLSSPEFLLCGPDKRLYVNENRAQDAGGQVNRLLRFNQDGSGRTLIAEWPTRSMRASSWVFAVNGDLFYGTVSTSGGRLTQGVWRISNALQSDTTFAVPQLVLPPEVFSAPFGDRISAVQPEAFLTSGAFQGDLLILDYSNDENSTGDRVLRALKPNFDTVKEFIAPYKDSETGKPFEPSSLAIASNGELIVGDFVNGKLLRYGQDGTFKEIFARVKGPNHIAIGPDDLIYVTSIELTATGSFLRGNLFVFDLQGKLLTSSSLNQNLNGVAVCAPN